MSQDILVFLTERASETPLTAEQFLALRSELVSQLNALSVDVPGSTETVLYSGHIGGSGSLHSSEVALSLASADPAIRIIDKIKGARLVFSAL